MRSLLFTLILSIAVTVSAQDILYLDASATGDGSGSSWSNAFTSFDSAFAYYQTGDTIWVAQGTYKPSGGTNSNFSPPNGAKIYGGFSGNESSLAARSMSALSVMDGDINTNGTANDNCRNVVYITNNTSQIVIDGFKIRNGYAYTIGGSITVGGGGARIVSGDVLFENCEFSDNYTYMRGGAVAIYGSSSDVIFKNCLFKDNLSNTSTSSGLGGAVFANDGDIRFIGCEFTSNTGRHGGAISSYQPTMIVDRCTFSNNEATNNRGGAIENGSDATLSVYNSLFVGNYAEGSGAAVYSSASLNPYPQKYIGCTFANNTTSSGGSYTVYNSSNTTFANCIFWDNNVSKDIFYLSPTFTPTVSNCILSDSIDGGSNVSYDDPQFVNAGDASNAPFEIGSFDYSISYSSPAVNAGSNSYVYTNYNLDLYGNARIQGGTTDIGAIESPFVNFDVTVSSDGSKGVSVSGGGSYAKDSTATVVATGNDCFSFNSWKEDGVTVSTYASYTFTVDTAKNLVAHFDQASYVVNLTASPMIGGQVSGSGTYNCDPDSARTFEAIPANCYSFVNWTLNGTEISTSASLTMVVDSSMDLVANFEYAEYNISVSANLPAGGNVSGGGSFKCDSTLTLSATTNECYTFKHWKEGASVLSTDTFLVFNASADRTIEAVYEKIRYNINVIVDPVSGGSVSGDGLLDCGSTATLIATRKTNYQFLGWEENGSLISTNATYQFVVEEARTLKANFSSTGAVSDLELYGISLSPNPARDHMKVSLESGVISELRVMDVLGKEVITPISSPSKEITVDLTGVPAGVYWVQIHLDARVIVTRLIVE